MGRVKKKPNTTSLPFDDPFADDGPAPDRRAAAERPWSELRSATNDFGEVLYCPKCRGEQRVSPGGATCERGHGGVDGYPMGSPQVPVVPDHVHMEVGGKPVYPECPGCVVAASGKPEPDVEMTPDQRHARDAGLAAVAETRRQVAAMEAREKSTLLPPEEKPRTPLDDFLDETTRAVPEPKLDPSIARIIELVYEVDVEAEYRRLTDRLRAGVVSLGRAARSQHLDAVEHDTVMAARIHQVAAAHLARWRIDLREREAVFRAEAVRQLSLEKGTAERKKQITISDVEDYCVGNYGDEWRSNQARTSRMEGAVAVLAELLAAYRSRQATLRDLCRGDGG